MVNQWNKKQNKKDERPPESSAVLMVFEPIHRVPLFKWIEGEVIVFLAVFLHSSAHSVKTPGF